MTAVGRSLPQIPAGCNAAAPYPWHPDRVRLRCLLVDDNDAFLEAASVLLSERRHLRRLRAAL